MKHKKFYAFIATTICCASSAIASAAAQNESLILHYDFNDVKENIVIDKSGNNRDGRIHGAKITDGITGKAIEFAGNSDCLILSSDVPGTGPYAFSTWIYLREWPERSAYIFDNRSSFLFINQATKSIRLVLGSRSLYAPSYPANAPFALDKWHHLCVLVEGNFVAVYIDGTLQNSGILEDSPRREAASLVIGNNFGRNASLSGKLGEIRIYGKLLTPEEISAIYNQHAGD